MASETPDRLNEETPSTTEELRKSYRHLLAKSLHLAHNYCGDEAGYQNIMAQLIELEEWLKTNIGGADIQEREVEAAYKFASKTPRAINDVLDVAIRAFAKRLSEALELLEQESKPPELDLLVVKVGQIILPPGEGKILTSSGTGAFESPRFQNRLEELIHILQAQNIFIDDIIVIEGITEEHQMRQLPYRIVEIPRLQKEVLVCDEVGEATFVISGMLPRQELMTITKEELQDCYPDRVARIVYRNSGQWQKEIKDALFIGEPGSKINVRDAETLRQHIIALVTPETWVEMSFRKRRKFKINGLGLIAIATIFGIKGDATSYHKIQIELGIQIFGEDPVLVKKLQEEQEKEQMKQLSANTLAEKIKEVITVEEWAEMSSEIKQVIKFHGLGLIAIARKFEIRRNPVAFPEVFFELGIRIFGEHPVLLEKFQEELENEKTRRLSVDVFAMVIRDTITAEEWAEMSSDWRRKFNIKGLGLTAIASRFEIKGDPFSYEVFLKLGIKIFGEDTVLLEKLQAEQKKKLSLDILAEKIKEAITVEEWMEMTSETKEVIKFHGLGLIAIARKFEIDGNPFSNEVFLKLGIKIFGEQPVLLEKLILLSDVLAERIRAVITAEEWAEMSSRGKRKFNINGLGIEAIGTKFGIKGRSIDNHRIHIKLGIRIFGEHPALVKKLQEEQEKEHTKQLSTDELAEKIKEAITVEEWAEMSSEGRRKFNINGLGLRAIATRFGIKGDPASYHKIHIELGIQIFGEHPALVEKPRHQSTNKTSVDAGGD